MLKSLLLATVLGSAAVLFIGRMGNGELAVIAAFSVAVSLLVYR